MGQLMRAIVGMGIVLTALMLAWTGAAHAADMSVKAPKIAAPAAADFTGFYIGVHAGRGWGTGRWIEDGSAGAAPGIQQAAYDMSGFLGGGQAGFNYQLGSALAGIEVDFSGTDIRGTDSSCYKVFVVAQSCSGRVQWMASAAGRLGWVIDQALIYAKGGAAWSRVAYENPCNGCVTPLGIGSAARSGWLVGGGIEYAFAPSWSVKLEYAYVDFGTRQVSFAPVDGNPLAYFSADVAERLNLVTVGLNYRFNPGLRP